MIEMTKFPKKTLQIHQHEHDSSVMYQLFFQSKETLVLQVEQHRRVALVKLIKKVLVITEADNMSFFKLNRGSLSCC